MTVVRPRGCAAAGGRAGWDFLRAKFNQKVGHQVSRGQWFAERGLARAAQKVTFHHRKNQHVA